ncbi:hypothetical protein RRG08_051622 [Elysia crispata]|uniref:Uncharacterized protein n=1 Tax=Elysia crispata TaxID=231223 RepID=A0AAE1A2F5_9GAST|nr:hypothetical protein RRG08_051622 [Elysia crispata]
MCRHIIKESSCRREGDIIVVSVLGYQRLQFLKYGSVSVYWGIRDCTSCTIGQCPCIGVSETAVLVISVSVSVLGYQRLHFLYYWSVSVYWDIRDCTS